MGVGVGGVGAVPSLAGSCVVSYVAADSCGGASRSKEVLRWRKDCIRSVGGAGRGPEIKMKHRIVHALQKYFLNPPIKVLLALGVALPRYALLETIDHKRGKARRTPVGSGRVGNEVWIVAEHGRKGADVVSVESASPLR